MCKYFFAHQCLLMVTVFWRLFEIAKIFANTTVIFDSLLLNSGTSWSHISHKRAKLYFYVFSQATTLQNT